MSWLLGALGALVAAVGAWLLGRRSGKRDLGPGLYPARGRDTQAKAEARISETQAEAKRHLEAADAAGKAADAARTDAERAKAETIGITDEERARRFNARKGLK